MPSRSVIAGILLFWLAMAAWWFVRDVWPNWTLDDPPVYQVDLVDEFGPTEVNWVMWTVERPGQAVHDGTKVGEAKTVVKPLGPGLFEMRSQLDFTVYERIKDFRPLQLVGSELRRIRSGVKVDGAGALQEFSSDFTVRTELLGDIRAEMRAELRDGMLHPEVTSPFGKLPGLAPFPPPAKGSVLNPTLPSHRMRDLVPGKRWRIQLVNPLGGSPLTQPFAIDELEAQTSVESVLWHDEETPCIRLDTRKPGERRILTTSWVRRSDGLVIQMEVSLQVTHLILIRDPIKP